MCAGLAHPNFSSTFHLRIGITNLRQICRPRPGVEIGQQTVVARLRFQLGNAALGIVDVAEHNRIRRTRLLARGLHYTGATEVQDWLPGVARTEPRLGFWFWGVSSEEGGLHQPPFSLPRCFEVGRVSSLKSSRG